LHELGTVSRTIAGKKGENTDFNGGLPQTGHDSILQTWKCPEIPFFCLLFMQLLNLRTDDETHRNVAGQSLYSFQAFPGLYVLMEYLFPATNASGRYDSN